MKISTIIPVPPPKTYRLDFSNNEGWFLIAAMNEYIEKHPHAANVDEWKKWAKELDRELRTR